MLVTGMSGAGKSSALAELGRRGFRVADTDSPEWSEWTCGGGGGEGEWLWREDRIARLLASNDEGTLYVSGCMSNQGKFYDRFDAVVLLSAPAEVLLDRVAHRTTNDYGKGHGERELILAHLESVEPLLRATCTHELDASKPLADVVEALVAIGRDVSTRPSAGWSLPLGSLERWPDDYERGRPGWPPEALRVPGLPPTATVLELGAGTGKLTRLLVSAFRRVVAVEPADAMRRVLVRQCPEAEVLAGCAEDIPLPDGSADAVFAAEAFHRFRREAALAEVARVLRPRGTLVLLWNLPAGPTEPSPAAAEELLQRRIPDAAGLGYDPLDLNTKVYASGEWRRAFAGSSFEELRETRLPNPQTVDREGLVAFFASMGWIADLPDAERLPLLDEVRSLLAAPEYRRPWATHVHWTRLAAR